MLALIVTLGISCFWQGLWPVWRRRSPWDLVVRKTCLGRRVLSDRRWTCLAHTLALTPLCTCWMCWVSSGFLKCRHGECPWSGVLTSEGRSRRRGDSQGEKKTQRGRIAAQVSEGRRDWYWVLAVLLGEVGGGGGWGGWIGLCAATVGPLCLGWSPAHRDLPEGWLSTPWRGGHGDLGPEEGLPLILFPSL